MKKPIMPDTLTLGTELQVEWKQFEKYSDGETTHLDVRLQCTCKGWALHTGSAQYDQDHKGFWGSGTILASSTKFELEDLARDLLDQVEDQWCDTGAQCAGM